MRKLDIHIGFIQTLWATKKHVWKMIIPKDYIEFLNWLKFKTEERWASMNLQNVDEEFYWMIGAKWIGMKESDIKEVEGKYQINFTQEHKAFLKILHTIDKKQEGIFIDPEEKEYTKQISYFHNWLTDDDEINYRFKWSHVEILNDVKRGFWLKSWGERPESEFEIERIFDKWYNEAPTLIPISGHRFVVYQKGESKSPVLSVWGSDTIVYGWSLKHYLLNEIGGYIDEIWIEVFDDEDDQYYPEHIQELKDFNNNEWLEGEKKGIFYWYELIKAANPNWNYTPA